LTLKEIKERLFMDEVLYIKNPYYFIRDYEDKAVVVALKKEKDSAITYADLENICFDCPNLEQHQGVIKLIIFQVDGENKIKGYSIGASLYKILRSDILQYETIIGNLVEVE